MTIRLAEDSDIPAIVALLKLSLGESLMPKSEAFWKWKHINNPFGKSPVLLALEGEQLIGVRAFMRWEWKQGDVVYQAVRAVDTATHPAHQGKGIFSKLTRQLVEQCRAEGVDFIFNTPNAKSMGGYLKMGWGRLGRLPVAINLPWSLPKNPNGLLSEYFITDTLIKNIAMLSGDAPILRTNYQEAYFRWRYTGNPNEKYYCLHHPDEGLRYAAFFRLKKSRWGVELRVCDYLIQDEDAASYFHQQLKKTAKALGATYISMNASIGTRGFIQLPLGPVVTLNYLSGKINSLNFQTWNPSLGDLEIF